MNNSGKKTKLIAGLLCWFLGVFGAHRYYLGYKKSGMAMTILTVLGFVGVAVTAAAASQYRPDEALIALGALLTMCTSVAGVWTLVDFVRIIIGHLAPVGGYGVNAGSTLACSIPQIHPAFVNANAGLMVLDKYYKLYRKGALSKREYEETAADFLSRM